MNMRDKVLKELKAAGGNWTELLFLKHFLKILNKLNKYKKKEFKRAVALGDLLSDRWDKAKFWGFGEGSSVYDDVLIIGDVKVGKHTWIGPHVILDGSGGLEIGDYCDISAGVQIYSHNTVNRSISLGKEKVVHQSTKIGHGVYIGPLTVIEMGVTIGDRSVIGAMSFVNKDIPPGVFACGIPAKVIKEIKPGEERRALENKKRKARRVL